MTSTCNSDVGVVVIGRDEGERLRWCLESAVAQATSVVYVDAGSIDDSISVAREHGVEIVELDPTTPVTAARARNAGIARLREIDDAVEQYKIALEQDPSYAEAHYNLGLAYVALEEYEQALVHARSAYQLGYRLPGLKRQLEEAGAWVDNDS